MNNNEIGKNILISGKVLQRSIFTVFIVTTSILTGIKVDNLQDTTPLFTLIGIVVAILGMALSAYFFIKTMIKQLDKND